MSMKPDVAREYIEICMNKFQELETEKRKEFIRQILSYYDFYNQMLIVADSWGVGITEMLDRMEKIKQLFQMK